jgi:predicted DsbA family dithiol-disulfide isomerase
MSLRIFVCPWCFIGSRRLQAALKSFGHMDVVTRCHPYSLYPDVSVDGIDLRASLAQRHRQSPERLFEPVEAAGREVGIPLDFSRVVRVYSTLDAHTLARHAQQKGTASAYAEGIFTAYFLEGGISLIAACWWTTLSIMVSQYRDSRDSRRRR